MCEVSHVRFQLLVLGKSKLGVFSRRYQNPILIPIAGRLFSQSLSVDRCWKLPRSAVQCVFTSNVLNTFRHKDLRMQVVVWAFNKLFQICLGSAVQIRLLHLVCFCLFLTSCNCKCKFAIQWETYSFSEESTFVNENIGGRSEL